jgi:hypothetical protein
MTTTDGLGDHLEFEGKADRAIRTLRRGGIVGAEGEIGGDVLGRGGDVDGESDDR